MNRTVRSLLILAVGLAVSAPPAAQAADSRPELTVSDVRKTEPGSGSTRARFFFRLDEAARVPMYVRYATVAGSATPGADYTSRRGRIMFRPGEKQRFVDIRILGDTADERRETFTLRASDATDRPAASRPRLKDRNGRATIIDRDPTPTIAVYGASGPESSEALSFRVRLSRTTYRAVTVNYATKTGTAGAQDFVSRSGRLSIPSGSTEALIPVALRNDTLDESDERFSIELTGPRGGRLTKPTANAAIVDDDSPRTITIDDTTVAETSGTATLNVRVGAPGPPVTVSYATHSGTAAQGVDFAQTVGEVTIPSNATTAKITIPITTDFLDEDTEFFTVEIVQPKGGTITDPVGRVTIIDNDLPPFVDVIGTSGNEGTPPGAVQQLFPTILLSKDSGLPITVTYRSVDDTAIAGSDYTAVSGTLTFNPGETSKVVPIPITPDSVMEPNEQLRLEITSATNARIGAASGTAVIVNDD